MTGNYNSWLVFLSIVVATVASYVALDLASRVAATQGTRSSRYWLFGGALSMGTGIWSMHFIGMLAFQLPIQMSYNIPITLASLLIAAIASGFALYSISHGSLSWRRLLLAGLLMGIGIAAMHYTGMAAMELNPPVRYSPSIFTASVVIAIVASMVALWIAFQLRTETILSAFWKKAGSAVVMGVAITGMHYTGMAAAVFAPDTVCSVSPQDINNVWLAGAIGGFTFMLLATTLLVSVFDAHLANRAAKHAENLRLVNVDLEKQAAELSQTNVQLQEEVKERARSEEKIQYLAYHDGLTTLPNRALFSKILNHGISQAHRRKKELAVLFIDLDRFKNINDTLGHEAGDSLLQEVGKRLKQCLRESDTVARLGGDEFVVLLEDLEDQTRVSVVAHKILVTLVKPFTTLGQEFRVTASIGISTYPTDGEDEKSLMKNADIAMYRAKEEGKNNFQFYSKELNEHSFERLTMESNLRRALERNEFELHYQPKVDLRTSRITGVEALLRWRHPELGMVGPLQFIPMAEETGLIVPIGKWVLRTACRQQKAWQDQGLPQMSVAVNLSARQFSDENLLQDITAIVKESGMDPTLLELEITESMLMHNVEKAIRTLDALNDMGIRLAIDDFGTGYSSLSTLKRFPINTIKVDRSFIRDLPGGVDDHAITDAIIAMGRTLGMTVIAEGVETKEQADYLREQSCDEFQGFYFKKPMPANELVKLLQAPVFGETA
ncbi:MAG TPA: EAL domain-containing protein [Burkholderiales bacterium]|nr:EAL domain-containing protein [Burkholderiales bacterium]